MSESPVHDRTSATWPRVGSAPMAMFFLLIACASSSQPGHHPAHFTRHHAETGDPQRPIGETPALDLGTLSDLETLIPALAEKRVVLIGEIHDRLDHHLIQLEIIRGLHAIHPRIAIGMEFFQQRFQHHLDDYVAGRLSQRELLRETEYYRHWRFDFRLYEPILSFAREQGLPLVALNLPPEIVRKVGWQGLDALSDEERADLPEEIDRSDSAYAARLEEIFEQHPSSEERSFDHWMEAQLLWDEAMAQHSGEFLASHPDHKMVILAGGGHIAYGSGIPRRLARRMPVSTAIVLAGWEGELEPGLGDYLLLPQERPLPAAGKIGAFLEEDEDRFEISSCAPDSGCEKAGLKSGDQIISIDGQPVTDMADLKVMMWDKSPGDSITMEIRRKRWPSGARQLTREIVLQ